MNSKRDVVSLSKPNKLAHALALALAVLAAPLTAHAGSSNSQGNTANNDSSYDPFAEFDQQEENTASSETALYRDRIIASDKLQELPPDEDENEDDSGLPRSLYVELIANRTLFAGENNVEAGIGLGGFWDTSNYGAISANALLFRSDRERNDGANWRGSATLWQRGLQMPGGWSVNNGLGVLNTLMPNMLRDQYRFILPSVPIIGASTEWQRASNRTQWQASFGRGGSYTGSQLSGFEFGDSTAFSLGSQWSWSDRISSAANVLVTDGRIVPDDQGLPEFQNGKTSALLSGHRWQGKRDSFQLNLLLSDSEQERASGAWLDARSDRGRYTHRYGLFNLQPQLAWGAWPINNDVRGGYYRFDFSRARWSLNAGIDRIDSISGTGFDGWYANSFLRYQATPRLGYGGGITARENNSGLSTERAQTLQLFLDKESQLGQTRFQYDRAHDDSNADSWQFLVDHALRMREGSRLSLSAGIGQLAYDNNRSSQTRTLAANGGFNLTDNFSLDGGVRWSQSDDPGADDSRSLDLNLGWRWRIATHWSVMGNISENRGTRRSPFALDPLTNQPLFSNLPNDRSVFVSLRYDRSAGRVQGVLGGAANAATGVISGSVFLDDNNDGVRSASEQPAANITLLLDQRFTVRTDDQGRFRFERVSVGTHTISVVADNLPLPWSIDEERAEQQVSVEVRKNTVLDIGAVRQR